MKILDGVDVRAAVAAGLVAGVGYFATMQIDNRISGKRIDDLVFLGAPIAGDKADARKVGAVIHAINSATFGVAYAAIGRKFLPGPPAVKGALFFNIENTLLYPLTALDTRHPAVIDGRIDRYWSLSSYLWSVPRHIVYGALLGVLYERWKRTES